MKPLSRYIEVDTSPERISRIWERVRVELDDSGQRARQKRPSRLGWVFQPRFVVIAGAALAASVVVAILSGPWSWGPWGGPRHLEAGLLQSREGATLETSSEPLALSMDDGSGLALSPNTKIRIAQDTSAGTPVDTSAELIGSGRGRSRVSLHLTRGKVHCDVAPNPARSFVVDAKGVEVRVTGTSFSVELSPNQDEVRVAVQAGTVEVAPPGAAGHERRLSAGEVWTINLVAAASSAAVKSEPPAGELGTISGAAELPSAATPAANTSLDGAPERVRKPNSTSQNSGPSHAEVPSAQQDANAAELFDRANAARRAGDAHAAARGFEELLAKFPKDGRAGLAAFELGRLRMDRLGDTAGAVSALKRAVALAPGAGFREDAMARLVQAYAASGVNASCKSARDAYLRAYPSGVHVASVSRKCD